MNLILTHLAIRLRTRSHPIPFYGHKLGLLFSKKKKKKLGLLYSIHNIRSTPIANQSWVNDIIITIHKVVPTSYQTLKEK